MEKKPVTKSVVILFGVAAVIFTVYAMIELMYGVPDMLRLLRLVVAGVWIMGFVGMSIKYKKQQKAAQNKKEADQD